MALLAESLVEEWLNRAGYFTIRGAKEGVEEMDILAVRFDGQAIAGLHVEVQVSFRPVGYIAKRTKAMVKASGVRAGSAKNRTVEEVEECARDWVRGKYLAPAKTVMRERLWPGLRWSFRLIHGILRDPHELAIFTACGVECVEFVTLLDDLTLSDRKFSGSAGGDLAEIVAYHQKRAHP